MRDYRSVLLLPRSDGCREIVTRYGCALCKVLHLDFREDPFHALG